MPYNIKLTNSTPLVTVLDGTVDQSATNLTLVGREYPGYGTFINENFIYLLENFSSGTAPTRPLLGQLWWDSTNKRMKICVSTSPATFRVPPGTISAATSSPPTVNAVDGDLWFDNTASQLNVWSSSQNRWVLVGPLTTSSEAFLPADFTGATPGTFNDIIGNAHTVIKFNIGGVVYAVISRDATFNTTVTGFNTVIPGLNFNTSLNLGQNNAATTATPDTLVQRTGTGGIAVTDLSATSVAIGGAITGTGFTVSSPTGFFNGNLNGNVTTGSSSIRPTRISAGIFDATAGTGYFGTIQTAAQPQITTLGTINNLGATGSITFTGTGTYNGQEFATKNSGVNFLFIDATPLGPNTASTVNATFVQIQGNLYPLNTNNANFGDNVGNGGLGHWWNTAFIRTANIFTLFSNNISATSNISAAGNLFVGGNINVNNGLSGNVTSGNVVATTGTFVNVTMSGALSTGTTASTTGTFINVNTQNLRGNGNTTVISHASIVPSANVAGAVGLDLGSTTNWWRTFYGVSVQAKYADLAERFHADAAYAPGTVVEMGGINEITAVVDPLSDRVFGVVSTQAAYLMNSGAGDDATHPPIAMSGRVPVLAVGLVGKGDRLVSAGSGRARAGTSTEITAFNVIGRSLVNKTDTGESLIEALVKINS
jgi:hypothetical protein